MAKPTGERLRSRAQELRDGMEMRTHLVDRDFAIDILEWCADELDGKHDDPASPTDDTAEGGEA